jgi:spore maturation protein CgeB
MNVLFSSNINPNFKTFSDYIEKAFRQSGCKTCFFENRAFAIPGRIRDRIAFLQDWDLRRLNKRLLEKAAEFKPQIYVEAGGWNILPETIDILKSMGIKTALWTIDPPHTFKAIIKNAPHYDFVFCQGTEAIQILKENNVNNLHWLPFACDADFHKPSELAPSERKKYETEVCFVGSWNPGNKPQDYAKRQAALERLTDYNLGIWGPGWNELPAESNLKKFIRGFHTKQEEWVKIYSATQIVIIVHYQNTEGNIPCYQASPKVFEALACGAFLVVDDQRDILSLFESGQHLVVYHNHKELREIISYHLEHPDEARKIAQQGRKEVLENHTFRHRVDEMLGIMKKG